MPAPLACCLSFVLGAACKIGTVALADAVGTCASGPGDGGMTERSVAGLLHPGPGVDGTASDEGGRCGGGVQARLELRTSI